MTDYDAVKKTAVDWAIIDERDPYATVNACDSSGRKLQIWELYLTEARKHHVAIENHLGFSPDALQAALSKPSVIDPVLKRPHSSTE